MKPRGWAAVAIVSVVSFAGCGYHTAGAANHIPATIQTLSVPMFTTRALQYRTEVVFTDAVIHELNTRTRYRIVNSTDPNQSDAVLRGMILTESIAPLTYDAASGATSSYLVTIQAKISLTTHDGRVLYSNDRFLFRDQYQSTQDLSAFIQEDGPAVKRLARDFAQAAVSDLLYSF